MARMIVLDGRPRYNGIMVKQERARVAFRRLRKTYHRKPGDFVRWKTPLQLVIATVLSAQCTDKKVNEVTRALFKRCRSARDFMTISTPELEQLIRPTGFYRSKTKYLKGIGTLLVHKFGGRVPRTREELLQFPGISFKTANLIMGKAFGVPTGVAVDTHVNRVAPRLGLTEEKKSTEKKAADLEKLYLSTDWLDVNEYMILHGRAVCVPRKPKCPECPLRDICPSAPKFMRAARGKTP